MTAAPNQLTTLRVDQVGSLIRPEGLREMVARHRSGEASDEELRAAQDEAIREVIAQQEAVGFPVVTDGEFRRFLFQETFGRSTSGWDGPPHALGPDAGRRAAAPSPQHAPPRVRLRACRG